MTDSSPQTQTQTQIQPETPATPTTPTTHYHHQQITIETPRLLLRAARLSDAIPLHETFSDPEVMRYWSEPPHPTQTRTTQWLNHMTNSPQNGVTDFIITLKSTASSSPTVTATATDPLPIGKIGIYRPPPSNEIGFLLSRSHWGLGLAKEALTYILQYLFSLEALPYPLPSSSPSTSEPHTSLTPHEQTLPTRYASITADADPRNAACRGLLRRMGFTETGIIEGTYVIGGVSVDSVYLRVERDGWLDEMDPRGMAG